MGLAVHYRRRFFIVARSLYVCVVCMFVLCVCLCHNVIIFVLFTHVSVRVHFRFSRSTRQTKHDSVKSLSPRLSLKIALLSSGSCLNEFLTQVLLIKIPKKPESQREMCGDAVLCLVLSHRLF